MSLAAHTLRVVSNRATRRIAIRYGADLSMFPVLGFPRSGGTWLSKMLALTLDLPFAQIPALPVAMPSVVQGHWRYHPRLRNTTVITRDGRDVMVSFYFYCKLRYESGPTPRMRRMIERLYGRRPDLADTRRNLPVFIQEMFDRPIGSSLTWPEYCSEWSDRPGVARVRYEGLITDAPAELARLADFHNRPAAPERIRMAAEINSMARSIGRNPGEEDRGSIVRKGIAGDWVSHFSDESRERFADLAGGTLVQLGYERSPAWRSWSAATPQAGAGNAEPSGCSPS